MFARLTTLFTALAATSMLVACEPQHPIEPILPVGDGLFAVHVSGHLGSYRDCPEQAYENVSTDRAEAGRAGPPGDADADFAGDCAFDDCGPLNCEAAQLTLTVRNDSDVEADGVEVVGLFLLDWEGVEAAELPIGAVTHPDGTPFDGVLDAGEEAMLRVEFAGPLNLLDVIGDAADQDGDRAWNIGTSVRVLVGAATHQDTGLDTPELFSLPEVDT